MGDIEKISAVAALKEYVKDLKKDHDELQKIVTDIRIDQAVTKTKLGVYVVVVAFAITSAINLLFLWLKGKIIP